MYIYFVQPCLIFLLFEKKVVEILVVQKYVCGRQKCFTNFFGTQVDEMGQYGLIIFIL
jgi:hypothetical protein